MSHSEKPDASIIQALRGKGYKATPQRIAICRCVLSSREHPSVQRIHKEVKEIHATVSLATVYKTLQVLTELGLIQELDFPKSQARFDCYVKPHVNLVCLRCGKIWDMDDPAAREMVTRIAATAGFTRTGQRLDIYGVCKTCGSKTK